jgi:hypothetical protein
MPVDESAVPQQPCRYGTVSKCRFFSLLQQLGISRVISANFSTIGLRRNHGRPARTPEPKKEHPAL